MLRSCAPQIGPTARFQNSLFGFGVFMHVKLECGSNKYNVFHYLAQSV